MCACETGMYKVRVCVCLLQVAGQSVPAVHRYLHLPFCLKCVHETGMSKVCVCECLLQVAGQSVPAVHRHLHLPPALQAAHQVRSLQVACWSSPQLTNTEHNLKQNEAQWLWRINRQISTQKTSPTVTLTWHANKYTVHKTAPEVHPRNRSQFH